MKYFKNIENKIYAYESDGSQDGFITSDLIQISEQEAKQIIADKAEQDFNSLSYSVKRAAEYPDFKEYLDGIVKGDQAQISDYIAKCQAVKNKYPKEQA